MVEGFGLGLVHAMLRSSQDRKNRSSCSLLLSDDLGDRKPSQTHEDDVAQEGRRDLEQLFSRILSHSHTHKHTKSRAHAHELCARGQPPRCRPLMTDISRHARAPPWPARRTFGTSPAQRRCHFTTTSNSATGGVVVCPERVTSPARQTVGNNRVQSVSESDVKSEAHADRRCLRGARQGVSFALLKGLVHRFLHTRRPPLYFLIPLFVNIIERVSRTSFYPTS